MALEEKTDTTLALPKETLEWFGGDELSARIWFEKYALRDPEGKRVELTPDEMFRRVAHEIASVETESKRSEVEQNFYNLLEGFKFLPGGRILFGAGQGRRSTLLNCYYFDIKGDSIEAIFDWCKEAARTYSFGGGMGVDVSILRPRGSKVNNSAVFSTGAVSFMQLMSTTTETIGQNNRRGALLISIEDSHPDVLEFIKLKRDLSKVSHANISVKISDEFMHAVETNGDFKLKFHNEKVDVEKTVKASDIWNELIKSSWMSSEPCILFWDTIKRESPSEYNGLDVHGTNPCGEQPLDNYNACCLGSINLNEFVLSPFTNEASVDMGALYKAVHDGVRFLDDVITYNLDKHPLPQQREASERSRRVGLGITGLADMLIKMGLKYDTSEAIAFTETIIKFIRDNAYIESTMLAQEKGVFPAFDSAKHLSRPFVQRLPEEIRDQIQKHGLRNVCILTIPPTGSISAMAGVSSGVEPIFANSYTRRSESLSKGKFKVFHPLVDEYMKATGKTENELPDYFVTAHNIKPEMRIEIQGMLQKYIDSAISSTVNLPQDVSEEDVGKIFMNAWKAGIKGITIYREGSRKGILETNALKKEPKMDEHGDEFERPKILEGKTIKMKLTQGSLYLTLNSNGKEREVFVTLGKAGSDAKADAEALGRLISLYLQGGGSTQTVVKSLKGIQSQTSFDDGQKLLSIPDAVSQALAILTNQKAIGDTTDKHLQICPECGDESLVSESGCVACRNCGFSKC